MSYEPAKIHIDGPYDQNGVTQGPPTTHLFLGQSATDTASTQSNAQDIPTQDDDESILAPLQGKRNFSAGGLMNGHRLHAEGGYGNSPEEALINWAVKFESLVQSEMGAGYKLTDDTRNLTFDPISDPPGILFESARWTYETGEGMNAEWELEGRVGEGMQDAADRSQYMSNEMSGAMSHSTDKVEAANSSLEIELGEVSMRRYEREVNLDVMDMVHQTDVPVVGISTSGVQGSLMFDGRITDRDVSDLSQVARQINSNLHGIQADMYDAFTGRIFSGAIEETNTTFEAGVPNILEYRIELRIGESVV